MFRILAATILLLFTFFFGLGSSISHDFTLTTDSNPSFLIFFFSLISIISLTILLCLKRHFTRLNILPIYYILMMRLIWLICDLLNNREFAGSFFFLGFILGSLIAIHPSLRIQIPKIFALYIFLSWLSVLVMSMGIKFIPSFLLTYSDHFLLSRPSLYFGLASSDGIFLNNNTLSAISVTTLAFLMSTRNTFSLRFKYLTLLYSLFVSYLSQNATLSLFSFLLFAYLLFYSGNSITDLKISRKLAITAVLILASSPYIVEMIIYKFASSGSIKLSTLLLNLGDSPLQAFIFGSTTVYSESSLFDLASKIGFLSFFIYLFFTTVYVYNLRMSTPSFQPLLFFVVYVLLLTVQNSVLGFISSILLGASVTLPLSSPSIQKNSPVYK